jgi:isochorismate hydrolase
MLNFKKITNALDNSFWVKYFWKKIYDDCETMIQINSRINKLKRWITEKKVKHYI